MTSETTQVKFERRIFKFQLKERAIHFYESFQGNAYANYQNPKSTLISKRVNDDARRACICDMMLKTSADAEDLH
jgi:hypothetical protein